MNCRPINGFHWFFLLVLIGAAQSAQAQVRLAVEGGLHSAQFRETNSLPGFDTATGQYVSNRSGFRLGVMAEIPLSTHFYFQPGIQYNSKGNKYEKFYDSSLGAVDTLYDQHTLKLNYIQLPLLFTYKLPLSKKGNSSFFVSAGPYVSFIMTATEPYQNRVKEFNTTKYIYTSDKTDLPVGNGEGKYSTTDIGMDIKAGFEIGRVMISGYFSRGFSNAYKASYPSTFHHQLAGATLGIWLSGGKPPKQKIKNTDSDKDGIVDALDSCPAVFGWKRYHGCPIPDTDGDRINDEVDSCRTVAGPPSRHGCPIPDTDNDGVNDEEDSCKSVPGSPDYHGCPVPDSDRDGLNDSADLCPDVPGTKENNGCPPPPPPPPPAVAKAVAERVIFIAHNVQFRKNSTKLTTSSAPALRELADTLNSNPDLALTIEGYTDNVGRPAYNKVLSAKRAETARRLLISYGVSPSRVGTRGFGDQFPVAENDTESGRSQNRRVEFKLHPKNR